MERWQDLYDYPMSWDFWRAACVFNGDPDPGPNRMPKEAPDPTPEPKWAQRQWDIVNQLQSEIRGWRQKYNETLNELEKLKPRQTIQF